MTVLVFALTCFGFSIVAGALGAFLGIGGGIIIVPVLTLLLGVDIHSAIGASIVAVVATSSGAAATYLREHLANLRVAMLLEVSTVCGALCGALLAGMLAGRWLYAIFGLVLLAAAGAMLRSSEARAGARVGNDRMADTLRLHGQFLDRASRPRPDLSAPGLLSPGLQTGNLVIRPEHLVQYRVSHTRTGFLMSYFAGAISGLLGVGGGIVKVPMMHLVMGMPLKAATATSNLMIGVTAAAGAAVYFARGDIQPFIAGPVACGVLIGSATGARLLRRADRRVVRGLFVIVLMATAVQMLIRSVR